MSQSAAADLAAFDSIVKACRIVSESLSDHEVTTAFTEFYEDIGAGTPTGSGQDGLRALRNILAHFDEYMTGDGFMGADVPFHPFTWKADSGRKHLYFGGVVGIDLVVARGGADRLLETIAQKLRVEGSDAQQASPG